MAVSLPGSPGPPAPLRYFLGRFRQTSPSYSLWPCPLPPFLTILQLGRLCLHHLSCPVPCSLHAHLDGSPSSCFCPFTLSLPIAVFSDPSAPAPPSHGRSQAWSPRNCTRSYMKLQPILCSLYLLPSLPTGSAGGGGRTVTCRAVWSRELNGHQLGGRILNGVTTLRARSSVTRVRRYGI